MLYCWHSHSSFVCAFYYAVLTAKVPCLQVRELLQHRTGATALAQQTAGTRNAVEVLGLQKVYRSSTSRQALAHLRTICNKCTNQDSTAHYQKTARVRFVPKGDFVQLSWSAKQSMSGLQELGQEVVLCMSAAAGGQGLLGHQGLLVCH